MNPEQSNESKIIEELYITLQLILLIVVLNEAFPMFTGNGNPDVKLFSFFFAIHFIGKFILYFFKRELYNQGGKKGDKQMPNILLSMIDGLLVLTYILIHGPNIYLANFFFFYIVMQSIRYANSFSTFFATYTALLFSLSQFYGISKNLNIIGLITNIILYYLIAISISITLKELGNLQADKQFYYDALKEKNMELEKLASTDFLTALGNHQSFYTYFNAIKEHAFHKDYPISLALMDIDNFKKINDTYGHLVGDAILKDLASLIKKQIRQTDYAARYGGEEFAIVFPHTTIEQSRILCERIRKSVENHLFQIDNYHLRITISIGVSTLLPLNQDQCGKEFINDVDHLLYKAKSVGKNNVQAPLTITSTFKE